MLREGDWVLIKSLGEKGVVVTVSDTDIRVRVPRSDDWPYPDYIQATRDDVRRTKPPSFQSHNPIEDIEPALL